MKIFVAQQNYIVGDLKGNTLKILQAIGKAKDQGADLVVFSEMCICGYLPQDIVFYEDFINECADCIDQIRDQAEDIGVIVGAPSVNTTSKGKPFFNAAYFLFDKKIQAVVHKTCLPNYDIFDEYRYFEPAREWETITFKEKKIALTICEDIWNLGKHRLYTICPMEKLMEQQPSLMINISASPFHYMHSDDRKEIVKENVLKYKIPMVYCNAVGAQTEIIFDGASLAFDKTGNLCCELAQFREDESLIEVTDEGELLPKIPGACAHPQETNIDHLVPDYRIHQIKKALILGMRDYFRKSGLKKAIVGNSGGIDSAVTIALACEALGNENVLSVLMPSQYSSDHSISDGKQLAENLNCKYEIIPIKSVFHAFVEELKPVFQQLPADLAEENIQARIRGTLLMAIANKMGYTLLNTSNKSELAVGYGTLYGDMAGGLSVLGDCYKLQVYELAKAINQEKELIPANILSKAPSAELRPGQFDEQSLPPYPLLDPVLFQYIEKSKSASLLIQQGYDAAIVDRAIRLVKGAEFKRHQFCPILRVSPKAFGSGRRIPVVAKY